MNSDPFSPHIDPIIDAVFSPRIAHYSAVVRVHNASSSDVIGTVSYPELVKYLEERDLIENNETVRALWERYQVAVKLARGADNGQADD